MSFGPPPESSIKIYATLPDPSQDSFESGLRCEDTSGGLYSIVFYAPNLEVITALDNSNSACTSQYEVSVSRGFTSTTMQSFSISESVGVNAIVTTASISTTFALSFSQEWTVTQTRTVRIVCPGGEKAFVYQGTLMSRIMQFSTSDGSYAWYTGETASKTLTDVTVTSTSPIGKAPSNGDVTVSDS